MKEGSTNSEDWGALEQAATPPATKEQPLQPGFRDSSADDSRLMLDWSKFEFSETWQTRVLKCLSRGQTTDVELIAVYAPAGGSMQCIGVN